MSRFDTVLVANRGEIACRVLRTAAALGYRTVAVYSQADENSPHVALADHAICLGAAAASESYLNIDKIIQAAKDSAAQAIHPGYGFLSENETFAQACADNDLTFIGPTPEAIRVMGNKAAAKRKMLAANVPCVPGYQGEDQSDSALLAAAEEIGFPIMVKAAAGGGGRGMRLVDNETGFQQAVDLAKSEASSAFGSDELILEKAIIEPRHVEVQVFADEAGNTVYLGERDCSVQRRHQKVIEEAPCPALDQTLREKMGEAAVAAAQSINYVGAGTVEFLLDAERNFYFLEMNTRLQVEHPVTELITGLDLVALQLQVAQGDELGLVQEDVSLNGHAIEVRLYTEDPAQDFLPMAGSVTLWKSPQGEGVRVDDGIRSKQEISPYYDPMVAKIIAHGDDREGARRRLVAALEQTALFGVPSNQLFLLQCLKKNTFKQGEATTAFIEDEFSEDDLKSPPPSAIQVAIGAVIDHELRYRAAMLESLAVPESLKNWSSGLALVSRYNYQFGQQHHDLSVTACDDGYQVLDLAADGRTRVSIREWLDDQVILVADGEEHTVFYHAEREGILTVGSRGWSDRFVDTLKAANMLESESSDGKVRAPMHGLVTEVFVAEGDEVAAGDRLLILEAMKMQHEIRATLDGRVNKILTAVGSQMAADDLLIELTEG